MNAADMQKVMDYLKRDSIVKVSSGGPGDACPSFSDSKGSQSYAPLVTVAMGAGRSRCKERGDRTWDLQV